MRTPAGWNALDWAAELRRRARLCEPMQRAQFEAIAERIEAENPPRTDGPDLPAEVLQEVANHAKRNR